MTKVPFETINAVKPKPKIIQRFNLESQMFGHSSYPMYRGRQIKKTLPATLYIPTSR